jgi:hypothetical protein
MVEHGCHLAVALANYQFRVNANRDGLSICKGEGEGSVQASGAASANPGPLPFRKGEAEQNSVEPDNR